MGTKPRCSDLVKQANARGEKGVLSFDYLSKTREDPSFWGMRPRAVRHSRTEAESWLCWTQLPLAGRGSPASCFHLRAPRQGASQMPPPLFPKPHGPPGPQSTNSIQLADAPTVVASRTRGRVILNRAGDRVCCRSVQREARVPMRPGSGPAPGAGQQFSCRPRVARPVGGPD